MSDVSLGIDIGGTKIALGAVDSEGQVIAYERILTHAESTEELTDRFVRTVREFLALGDRINCVGIGSAGPIHRDRGTISPVNIPVWRDFPVVSLIRELSQFSVVELIGDAMSMAYGEFEFGAGRGSRNMLGVVVSTGIGGGLVLDGALHLGNSANAGFIGHTVFRPDGPICACGGKGCVEAYASGPSMTAWAIEHGLRGDVNGFESVAAAARAGDAIALEAITFGVDALALTLANAAILNDLDRIVVGGGVSESGTVFRLPLERATAAALWHVPFARPCTISWAQLGAHAGLVGSAAWARRQLANTQHSMEEI